jgi:hypothetical protein
MAFGIRDAISAAVGCSLAVRENLQERIPPYMPPRRLVQTYCLPLPDKENGGIPIRL